MTTDKHTLFLVKSGVLLILVGLATGALVTFAMTGVVNADPNSALAAHLNGIIGGLLILGLAYTMPMLRYDDRVKSLLSLVIHNRELCQSCNNICEGISSCFGSWFIRRLQQQYHLFCTYNICCCTFLNWRNYLDFGFFKEEKLC